MGQISTVTFTTEYGQLSPYVAVLKGKVLSANPEIQLVDITHNLRPGDILGASYLLSTSVPYYSLDSIHLISVDMNLNKHDQLLIIKSPYGYLITADTGVASLINRERQWEVWVFKKDMISFSEIFPDKDIFPFIVQHLNAGKDLGEIATTGEPLTVLGTLSPSISGNMLKGQVIFIDGYENAITDIGKSIFDEMILKFKGFKIMYQRRSGITQLSHSYDDQRRGDTIALFNSFGYLEIAIKQGQAASLTGLETGSSIIIEFND